jgi:hypothetical protein
MILAGARAAKSDISATKSHHPAVTLHFAPYAPSHFERIGCVPSQHCATVGCGGCKPWDIQESHLAPRKMGTKFGSSRERVRNIGARRQARKGPCGRKGCACPVGQPSDMLLVSSGSDPNHHPEGYVRLDWRQDASTRPAHDGVWAVEIGGNAPLHRWACRWGRAAAVKLARDCHYS